MSSVPESIAREIIANDGYYLDDERVTQVVTYNNQFDGGLTYALVYGRNNPRKYHDSPACLNVRAIWQAT